METHPHGPFFSSLNEILVETEEVIGHAERRVALLSATVSVSQTTSAIQSGRSVSTVLNTQLLALIQEQETALLAKLDDLVSLLKRIEATVTNAADSIAHLLSNIEGNHSDVMQIVAHAEGDLNEGAQQMTRNLDECLNNLSDEIGGCVDKLQTETHAGLTRLDSDFAQKIRVFAEATDEVSHDIISMAHAIDSNTHQLTETIQKIDEVSRPVFPVLRLLQQL
jgi:hypothetical protein